MKPTTWSGYLEFDQVSFSWPNGVNVIDQCSFSLQAFHDVVLRNGSVTMDVLEDIVYSWVDSQ